MWNSRKEPINQETLEHWNITTLASDHDEQWDQVCSCVDNSSPCNTSTQFKIDKSPNTRFS